MSTPLIRYLEMDITSLAASADFSAPMGRAPFAAVVTAVEFVPANTQAAATAVAATVRTYTLYNRGSGSTSGTGAVVIARGALTSLSASQTAFATGLLDNVASTLPLNATTTSLTVAAGDILEWESSHSGATGAVDVGGKVIVTLSRV